ncbi:MAG TPA: hypothetical protein VFR01_06475 [Geobacterales bacterium]|nr:hypothetical protein [Geobacterales bacterium]
MIIFALLLAVAGVIMLGSSLYYAHRLPRPWDTVAALAVPIGMVLVLLGALLSAVPRFFS